MIIIWRQYCKKILAICSMLLLFGLLESCERKDQNEFENLPSLLAEGEDPLDFLFNTQETELEQQNPETYSNTNFFESDYSDIANWGYVRISQKDNTIRQLHNAKLLPIISMSRAEPIEKNNFPYDTQMGPLHSSQDNNVVNVSISKLITAFFKSIEKGSIDKNLNNYILKSELSVISRQIARSVEFSQSIEEVRIGRIDIANVDGRTAIVRVIRKNDEIHARAQFQFYFTNLDNNWFINAIEGDFNNLLVEYVSPGEFTPLGTTGVTQGF